MKSRIVLGTFCIHFGISVLFAQQKDITPEILHEFLGEFIDAEENDKYNIFGDIPGLTAAKIYKNGNKYQIHFLRNFEDGAQVLIKELSNKKFGIMKRKVRDRIEGTTGGVIFFVDESEWGETSANKKLTLRDGSQLYVTLEKAEQDTVQVQTISGLKIPVPDNHIYKIKPLRGQAEKGKFLNSDPNSSRLFFAPTGRGIESGSGYFADYFIFFPTLAFGVTDNLLLSGGVSLIPGVDSQIFYFAPKLTFQPSPDISFGTGFLYLAIPEDEDDVNLGYGVMTIGGAQKALTVGFGLPLTSNTDQNPILLIGGEVQLSGSSKFITENWLFTGDGDATLIFSGGIRFFGEKLAVDLALISTEEAFNGSGFPFLPWVDFSVVFGN